MRKFPDFLFSHVKNFTSLSNFIVMIFVMIQVSNQTLSKLWSLKSDIIQQRLTVIREADGVSESRIAERDAI